MTVIAPSDARGELKALTKKINDHLAVDRHPDIASIKELVDSQIRMKEDEVESLMPVPQYYGLGGTLAGIIFGVILLLCSKDLKVMMTAADSIEKGSAGDGISSLLWGVVIAMITTLVGIALSTSNSKKMSEAMTECGNNRDGFFEWLQENLAISSSASITEAFDRMSDNLADFNNTFVSNTADLGNALKNVNDTYTQQRELLDSINKLDVPKTAAANVKVLKELKSCCEQIDRFNQYLFSVNTYIQTMDSLNQSLNQQWIKTGEIDEMARYFRSQNEQITSRNAIMNEAVGRIDFTLKQGLDALSSNSAGYLQQMENASNEQLSKLNIFNEQQVTLIANMNSNMKASILKQETELTEKLHNISDIVDGLKQLPLLQEEISKLSGQIVKQNDNLSKQNENIAKLFEKTNLLANNIGGVPTSPTDHESLPMWIQVTLAASAAVLALSCLFGIIRSFII